MDWSNEPYVRLYREDSPEWTLLPWEARLLWPVLLKIVDRAGILPVGRSGAKAVAAKLQVPLAVVEVGIAALVEDGCLLKAPDGKGGDMLVVRNFILAQEATQTDAARKRLQRERRSAEAKAHALGLSDVVGVTNCDQTVTNRDQVSQSVPDPSRAVTSGHGRSLSLSYGGDGGDLPPSSKPSLGTTPPESARARDLGKPPSAPPVVVPPAPPTPRSGTALPPEGPAGAPWDTGPGVRTYQPVGPSRRLVSQALPPLDRADLSPTATAVLDALAKHPRAFGRLADPARLADAAASLVDTMGTHRLVDAAIAHAASVVGREEASVGRSLGDEDVCRIVTSCVRRAKPDGGGRGPGDPPPRPRAWKVAEGADR